MAERIIPRRRGYQGLQRAREKEKDIEVVEYGDSELVGDLSNVSCRARCL